MIGLHLDHFYVFWLEPIATNKTKEHMQMYYVGDRSANSDDLKQLRKENILDQLVEKHFSLWGYLKTKQNINKIKKNLWNEIIKGCNGLLNRDKDHLFYEYSEFLDRQSKYVISGQRTYEYYGHHWRLPLWDDEYLFFWQKVSLDYKLIELALFYSLTQ